jgi:hypothetical protein
MCLEVEGHTIAYADTLHAPDLSAILLSSRVHRRAADGCSFLADNSGCFLTYPTFTVKINDSNDCTIPCRRIQNVPHTFDFDSRRYLTDHSSKAAVAKCHQLAFRAMQRSRLVAATAPKGTPPLKQYQPLTDEYPSVPVHSIANSGGPKIERINSSELKRYFGCRKLRDWSLLESVGTGIHVVHDRDAPTTISDMLTIRRNPHGGLLERPVHALHTVGMDIGYGDGTSPGGHKYALTLVDYCTRHTWTYGLKSKTTESVIDALWSFFVDAGGIVEGTF